MPQIFHRSANTLSKLSLAGLLIAVGSRFFLAMVLAGSSSVPRARVWGGQAVEGCPLHHVLDAGSEWG